MRERLLVLVCYFLSGVCGLVYETGRIDEVHECPRCGATGSRAASDQTDAPARART